jgi:type IV pilus assembly protein PilV
MLSADASRTRQRGSSLIEVLVSLLLVAMSMLGLLSLQLKSLSFQRDSLDRRTAAVIAASFLDRVTVNIPAVLANNYDLEFNSAAGDDDGDLPARPACITCSAVQIADRDLRDLGEQVARRLPGGAAFVVGNGAAVTVFIGWVDPKRTQELSGLPVGTTLAVDPQCPAQIGTLADAELSLRFRCYQAQTF